MRALDFRARVSLMTKYFPNIDMDDLIHNYFERKKIESDFCLGLANKRIFVTNAWVLHLSGFSAGAYVYMLWHQIKMKKIIFYCRDS